MPKKTRNYRGPCRFTHDVAAKAKEALPITFRGQSVTHADFQPRSYREVGGLTGVDGGARLAWTPPAPALRTAAGRLGNTNADLVGALQALRGISAGTDVQEAAPRASVCARARASDACPQSRLMKPTISGGVLPTQPTPVGLSSKSKGHWHK